eukprot:scaffold102395_cov39-Phaeocystis_antarctica.AAC.1
MTFTHSLTHTRTHVPASGWAGRAAGWQRGSHRSQTRSQGCSAGAATTEGAVADALELLSDSGPAKVELTAGGAEVLAVVDGQSAREEGAARGRADEEGVVPLQDDA